MLSTLTRALLFFLPLFFWPNPVKFELPKVIFYLTLSLILVVYLIWKKRHNFFENHKNNLWFLWIGLMFLSALANERLVPSLIGDGYRHQGIIFFVSLGLWSVVFPLQKKVEFKKTLFVISSVVIIESLLTLINRNTFGETNALAGFLVLGVPIVGTILPLPFLLLPVLAIFLTGSKAGIGALIVQVIIVIFGKFIHWQNKKILFYFATFLVIIAGIFGVWLEKENSPFESRWLIWNLGLKSVMEKPILGYGPEGIIGAYEKGFRNLGQPLQDLVIDRGHNIFLDVTLFSGILGLLVFLLWFSKSAGKLNEKWRLLSLSGFLVFSFFQPLGVVHWLYLIYILSD